MSGKTTYDFTCKNAFGLWTIEDGEDIKAKRCHFSCTCGGKRIKLKVRSRIDKPSEK